MASATIRQAVIGLLSALMVVMVGFVTPTVTSAGPVAKAAGPRGFVPIDPAHTALLVMDMQQGIVSMGGPAADALISHIAQAEQASRADDVTVGFVRTAFAPGYPGVSPNNKEFGRLIGSGQMLEGSPQTRIDPRIAPVGGDPVITKQRVGAFSTNATQQMLAARHINTLVLTGIATSGVVLSTVRAAADRDYRIIVLSDCVTDPNPQVNRVLLNKVFPPQADVITSGQYVSALRR